MAEKTQVSQAVQNHGSAGTEGKAQLSSNKDRRKKRNRPNKAKQSSDPAPERVYTTDIERENGSFERYYQAQHLFDDPEEFAAFISALKTDLPTTFRVTGNRTTANDVNDIIRNVHVPNLMGIKHEGNLVNPLTPLPWYPGGLAWQIDVHKTVIRKVPEFQKMQRFLVYETEVGNISRQEAVSMLPPLVLDVEPHHRVIDMCAAPGSKTSQILEAMHTSPSGASISNPTGVVVANDSDYKRAGLLVHQSSRLPSPTLVVTNLDASNYPSLHLGNQGQVLEFDRILCDVPCSGDGTLRKNPIIWREWSVSSGNGLHKLQLRILQRAMRMLAANGRIVYSTCSLNPVENEAVIAAALKASNGAYQLVDISDRLPDLVRRPGLSNWQVCTDKGSLTMDSSFQSFISRLNEKQRAESKVVETMFPCAEVGQFHLERCWRIYPHLQNTGGFFVAVLERSETYAPPVPRKKALKRSAVERSDTPDRETERTLKRQRVDIGEEILLDTEMEGVEKQAEETRLSTPTHEEDPKAKVSTYKEDPYTYVDPGHPTVDTFLQGIHIQTVGATDGAMRFPKENLFVRNSDPTVLRSVYLSNDLVKEILTHNEPFRLRLISAGVKLAIRQDGGAKAAAQNRTQGSEKPQEVAVQKYRVVHDAVAIVLPFMSPDDIIHGDLAMLKVLIERAYPLSNEFPSPYRETLEKCG
ncbi:hypothetical protein FRC19_004308 [Serendipita sp. 401]|nr:hypothetical protein FRC19_004308 [Serendipita sp. 401]